MTEHIQINDVSPRVAYVADGIQSAFTYPFAILKPGDVEVWLDDVRQIAGYSVSGAGITGGGLVLLAVPPAAGTRVTLLRRLTLARTADYQADGLIRAKTLNDEFDFQVAALQQVAEEVGRSVRRSPTSASLADLTLPEPAGNRGLKWNAAGTALVNSANDPDATGDATQAAAAAQAAASAAIAARDQAQAAVGGVKVSADDAVAGPLDAKLVAGQGIVLTASAGPDRVLTIASDGTGATMEQRLAFLEANLAVNTLRDQIDAGWSVLRMVDGIADEFEDEAGVDTPLSANQLYDAAGDCYHNTGQPDAATRILLHFDGSEAGGVFTDSSANNFTVTRAGGAHTSTGQSKFGGSSCRFTTISTDFLHIPDTALLDMGASDFTVDFWVRFTSPPSFVSLFSKWQAAGWGNKSYEAYFTSTAGGQLWFRRSGDGVTDINFYGAWSPALDTWYHLAFERSGNLWSIFVDGAVVAQDTLALSLYNSASRFEIGAQNGQPCPVPGYMDEFRLSAAARYGGVSFARPALAYGTSPDMTLVSRAFTAASVPAEARLILLLQPMTAVAFDTDLDVAVSRDGGATWTDGAVTDEGAFDSATHVLSASVDLSAQPSGAAMRWRVKTLNNKEQRLHGVWMQWR